MKGNISLQISATLKAALMIVLSRSLSFSSPLAPTDAAPLLVPRPSDFPVGVASPLGGTSTDSSWFMVDIWISNRLLSMKNLATFLKTSEATCSFCSLVVWACRAA